MEIKKNIYIQIREALKEEFRHMAIPQNGASVVVTNEIGKILLLKKTNGNYWTIPGGVQELGEKFVAVAKRELLEETGIDYDEDKLIFLALLSGETRKKMYPNGDVVYNNDCIYLAQNVDSNSINIASVDYQDDGSGEYKIVTESSEFGWFDVNNLPKNTNNLDFIKAYTDWLNKEDK